MAVTISAVLIVRNESANIGACLDSIRRGVDEIVVLDTGSTDNTCELARQHGADVVESDGALLVDLGEMQSLGDFAEARNRALSLASGEWALIVDADHRYVWPTLDAVREATQSDRHDTYTLWYHMASKPTARPVDVVSGRKRLGRPWGSVALIRRGLGGPWYQGVIHETVAAWEERQHEARGTTRGVVTKSRIADYGHTPSERERLAKDRRNILLLERAVQLRPDPVAMTYLAMEYATARDQRALAMVERAWQHLGHPQLIGAHLLRLVVARCWVWMRQNRPETAWETLNEWDSRQGEPHPDVLTMRGLVAERLGLTDAAIAYYRAAVGPQPQEWVIRYVVSDTAKERLRALGA